MPMTELSDTRSAARPAPAPGAQAIVELPPGLEHFCGAGAETGRRLTARLEDDLRVWCADAGLASLPTVELRALGAAAAGGVRIRVGARSRWHRVDDVDAASAFAFGARLSQALYAQREDFAVSAAAKTRLRRCLRIDRRDDDPGAAALALFVHEAASLDAPQDGGPLAERLADLSDALFRELGLYLPPLRIVADATLAVDDHRLRINDLRAPAVRGLRSGEVLVEASADEVQGAAGSDSVLRTAQRAAGRRGAAVIARDGEALRNACRDKGWIVHDRTGWLVEQLGTELRRHAGALLRADAYAQVLDLARERSPRLVAAALQRFDIGFLVELLRELLDEDVAIVDLRAILEALLAIDAVVEVDDGLEAVFLPAGGHVAALGSAKPVAALTPSDCAECVRAALRRQICDRCTGGSVTLAAHLLAPDIEDRLLDAAPLTADEHERLVRAVAARTGWRRVGVLDGVLLTTLPLRRRLREALRCELPDVPVLSYRELAEHVQVQQLAEIRW